MGILAFGEKGMLKLARLSVMYCTEGPCIISSVSKRYIFCALSCCFQRMGIMFYSQPPFLNTDMIFVHETKRQTEWRHLIYAVNELWNTIVSFNLHFTFTL